MDQNIKQQIVETINGTTNVLVTVSSNPTVDELAACIGLTLVLNKLGKHATAVFSGKVPSTIEFLKPEETLETNTNSLRDFIIALDKSKADKLRYKVEDEVVKIFITPYKTSISEKDLDFSQGDFNVDVVLALGVHKREELDKAIVAHGRILHDATVVCINHDQVSNLGVYNWQDAEASSLCEMVVDLAETIQPDNFDEQTATALLTGIVAETGRFSNEKTSPRTMSLSAKLMAAGANQQLVASKLQTNLEKTQVAMPVQEDSEENDEGDGGTLRIDHRKDDDDGDADKAPSVDKEESEEPEEPSDEVTEEPLEPPTTPKREARLEPLASPEASTPEEEPEEPEPTPEKPGSAINDVRTDTGEAPVGQSKPEPRVQPLNSANSKLTFEPPVLGGTLTANSRPEQLDPSTDGLSLPTPVNAPILNHAPSRVGQDSVPETLDPNKPIMDQETLTHIEKSVGSEHVAEEQAEESTVPNQDIDALAQAVKEAATESEDTKLEPLVSSGASPLDMNVQDHQPAPTPAVASEPVTESPLPTGEPLPSPVAEPLPQPDLPPQLVPPNSPLPSEQTASQTPQPLAPPVPPPIMPGFPSDQNSSQPPLPPAQ